MTPEDIIFVRHCLPEIISFPYFTGRENAWLMAHGLKEPMRVRNLRTGAFGKLLDRPVVKPVVAATPDGLLTREAFAALAKADISAAGQAGAEGAGAEAALSERWFDFTLTFDQWGSDAVWAWSQISRKGGNLVLQLGFPSDHARLMGATVNRNVRKECEYVHHPVRDTGCPTLAWVRLDLDLDTGEVLIEEVQSDWLRRVAVRVDRLRKTAPRSRTLKVMERYQRELQAAYARIWPRAALLAALQVTVVEVGCRTVWMHMPNTGAALKHIRGVLPPRSLYTDLPKAFCFEPTADAPTFLERKRRRALSLLRKDGAIFWRLAL